MRNLPRPFLSIVTLTFLLVGCGSSDPLPGEILHATNEFGADEKRAAQALSIGSVRALSDAPGEYVQAMRCSIALKAFNESVASNVGLDDQQMDVLLKAQGVYAREVKRLARQEERSLEQTQSDLQEQADLNSDIQTTWQIAVGCLRKLA